MQRQTLPGRRCREGRVQLGQYAAVHCRVSAADQSGTDCGSAISRQLRRGPAMKWPLAERTVSTQPLTAIFGLCSPPFEPNLSYDPGDKFARLRGQSHK